MKLYQWIIGLMMAISASAALSQDTSVVTSVRYKGTLGSQPIAMTLLIKTNQIVPGSHYFYFRHLIDIPLTGTTQHGINVKEPGGGTFTLAFRKKGNNDEIPPTLENSTGLSGSWRSPDGKILPVVLTLSGTDSGSAITTGSRRYQDVTIRSDATFEAHVQGFYNAVMARSPTETARYVKFPLRVNVSSSKYFYVKNPNELRAQWNSIFIPAWLKAVANEAPHDLDVMNNLAVLGNGLAYFGNAGAEVINITP